MVKVKICGIRNRAAAEAAIAAGADYLGFNFVPKSKRYIASRDALPIINDVRGRIMTVGVFRNAALEEVNQVVSKLRLDFVQLHGDETPEYASQVEAPTIKAIGVASDATEEALVAFMRQYGPETIFLLDRQAQGTGEPVSLRLAAGLTSQFTCFLAGGLTPGTVAATVESVRPYGVDVAGGVERDGQTDPELVKQFVIQAQRSAV